MQPEAKSIFETIAGLKKGKAPFEALDDTYKEFKGRTKAIGTYAFFVPNLLPIDPELIKNILTKDFNYFHDRGMYHNKVRNSRKDKLKISVRILAICKLSIQL